MTKALLFTLIAACGAHSDVSAPSEDRPLESPEAEEPEGQQFCCDSVNIDQWSGENCVAISEERINTCAEVLFCDGNWAKSGGTTKCAQ